MPRSYGQVWFLLRRRFPAYTEEMRQVINATVREKGGGDISDEVVDAVWSKLDLDLNELRIGDEAEGEQAEQPEDRSSPLSPRDRERLRRFIDVARDYQAKLWDEMPDAEFLELYELEKRKERAEAEAQGEEEDKWRFAKADIEHWARMPIWSIDQAVALSFGKEPSKVNFSKIRRELERGTSPFATRFERRRDLVARAVEAGELKERMSPAEFLAWARNNELQGIPEELEKRVRERGQRIATFEARIADLETQLTEAQARIVRLEAEAADEPLHPRERTSLYMLALGLAVKAHRYDPRLLRNKHHDEIAKFLSDLFDKNITAQAVHDNLHKAAEHLDYPPPKI